ncbi:hypothetical protein [Micromonospora sp. NPDC005161]
MYFRDLPHIHKTRLIEDGIPESCKLAAWVTALRACAASTATSRKPRNRISSTCCSADGRRLSRASPTLWYAASAAPPDDAIAAASEFRVARPRRNKACPGTAVTSPVSTVVASASAEVDVDVGGVVVGAVAADLGTAHDVRRGDYQVWAGPNLIVKGEGGDALGAVTVRPGDGGQVGELVADQGAVTVGPGGGAALVNLFSEVRLAQRGEGRGVWQVVQSPVITTRRVTRCRRRIWAIALAWSLRRSAMASRSARTSAGVSVCSSAMKSQSERSRLDGRALPLRVTAIVLGGSPGLGRRS